jgi:hypothetical protein
LAGWSRRPPITTSSAAGSGKRADTTVKLEAYTYERVLHAFWQIIDGESAGQVPTRL